MHNIPEFSSYGNYASKNYGAHSLTFKDPKGNQFWFSYQTLVAFELTCGKRYVHENDWGPTTGKHLNKIDGGSTDAKRQRMDDKVFHLALVDAFTLSPKGWAMVEA